MKKSGIEPNNWRDYQKMLKKETRRRGPLKKALLLGLLYLLLVIIFFTGSWIFAHFERADQDPLKGKARKDKGPEILAKQDLSAIFGHLNLNHTPVAENYHLTNEKGKFTVETSIDTALQGYILKLLKRSLTHQAGVVVLRPRSGQILAMANYQKYGAGEEENLCLMANFPAASLFKIISSAAAIEARGFTPDRAMVFRGMKHTLYKSQLRQGKDRYTKKTNFKRAFSGSINPVFGKIGIYYLGKELMAEYADKFLFNYAIPFDLPMAMSTIQIPADDFGLAEIASGFNKRTLISPLHASLITAAVANNGIMPEPRVVKRVKDVSGRVLYCARISRLARPIEEGTAQKLRILMEDTVSHGTCREAFRLLRRKKSFKDTALGAKTGTINDHLDRLKYDWLTAYALPNNGGEGICITVLAIHGKYLGFRAKDLARRIINYHFTH